MPRPWHGSLPFSRDDTAATFHPDLFGLRRDRHAQLCGDHDYAELRALIDVLGRFYMHLLQW